MYPMNSDVGKNSPVTSPIDTRVMLRLNVRFNKDKGLAPMASEPSTIRAGFSLLMARFWASERNVISSREFLIDRGLLVARTKKMFRF